MPHSSSLDSNVDLSTLYNFAGDYRSAQHATTDIAGTKLFQDISDSVYHNEHSEKVEVEVLEKVHRDLQQRIHQQLELQEAEQAIRERTISQPEAELTPLTPLLHKRRNPNKEDDIVLTTIDHNSLDLSLFSSNPKQIEEIIQDEEDDQSQESTDSMTVQRSTIIVVNPINELFGRKNKKCIKGSREKPISCSEKNKLRAGATQAHKQEKTSVNQIIKNSIAFVPVTSTRLAKPTPTLISNVSQIKTHLIKETPRSLSQLQNNNLQSQMTDKISSTRCKPFNQDYNCRNPYQTLYHDMVPQIPQENSYNYQDNSNNTETSTYYNFAQRPLYNESIVKSPRVDYKGNVICAPYYDDVMLPDIDERDIKFSKDIHSSPYGSKRLANLLSWRGRKEPKRKIASSVKPSSRIIDAEEVDKNKSFVSITSDKTSKEIAKFDGYSVVLPHTSHENRKEIEKKVGIDVSVTMENPNWQRKGRPRQTTVDSDQSGDMLQTENESVNSNEETVRLEPHTAFDRSRKFPEKLWMLAGDDNCELINWTRDGRAVVVHEKRFEQHIMQRHPGFVQTPSFFNYRRLCREYGFGWSYLGDDHYVFRHPYFMRDRFELLAGVFGKTKLSTVKPPKPSLKKHCSRKKGNQKSANLKVARKKLRAHLKSSVRSKHYSGKGSAPIYGIASSPEPCANVRYQTSSAPPLMSQSLYSTGQSANNLPVLLPSILQQTTDVLWPDLPELEQQSLTIPSEQDKPYVDGIAAPKLEPLGNCHLNPTENNGRRNAHLDESHLDHIHMNHAQLDHSNLNHHIMSASDLDQSPLAHHDHLRLTQQHHPQSLSPDTLSDNVHTSHQAAHVNHMTMNHDNIGNLSDIQLNGSQMDQSKINLDSIAESQKSLTNTAMIIQNATVCLDSDSQDITLTGGQKSH